MSSRIFWMGSTNGGGPENQKVVSLVFGTKACSIFLSIRPTSLVITVFNLKFVFSFDQVSKEFPKISSSLVETEWIKLMVIFNFASRANLVILLYGVIPMPPAIKT